MNVYEVVNVLPEYLNGKMYNGSEKKFGVTIDGIDYIMKFRKRNWNNIESEYVASNVMAILGANVHQTYLGNYCGETVVLCRDFTDSTHKLKTFKSTESILLDTDATKYDYYYSDVKHLLCSLPRCNTEECLNKFNEMFVYDALLGNPDRHKGNWGCLKSKDGYTFAPIFDNGACLFPRALNVILDESWVRERIYTFPNSKIMFNNVRERSSYYNEICNNIEFQEIANKITDTDIALVFTFIDNTQLSEYLKTMFKTVIYYRYKCIIKREKFVWEGVIC